MIRTIEDDILDTMYSNVDLGIQNWNVQVATDIVTNQMTVMENYSLELVHIQ